MTVRWTYGVLIALCAALAVLVHHDTASMGASAGITTSSMSEVAGSSMPGGSHAAHMAGSSMPSASHAGHVMPDEGDSPTWAPSSPSSADAGGCSASGMQHCTTAGVASVQLAVPDEGKCSPLISLREAAAGRVPDTAVGRAPPDLSVLSQLRI